MPTTLPARVDEGIEARGLGFRGAITVLWIVARMNALNWRMTRVSARWAALRRTRDRRRLLAAAQTWCRLSARLSALRGVPETDQARELQALFNPGQDGAPP